MRITLKIDGGFAYFPGLNRSRILDTEHLNAEDARTIESLVEQASFFELPALFNTVSPQTADLRTFTLTIHDGDHVHEVQFLEPVENQALEELIRKIQISAL